MSGGNWKDMFKAVREGDVGLVRYHLSTGVDPNYQHPEFGTSVLLEAVRRDQLEVARVLLEHEASPDVSEDWGDDTPISLARRLEKKTFVALLTKRAKPKE